MTTMDEAEKYQQRLQAIAEKRRLQEEEERAKRETEEEWLKQEQRKRKSLRDQWLMEKASAPASAPADYTGPQDKTESTEEQEGLEVKGEGEDQQRVSSNWIDTSMNHNPSQVDPEEEVMRQVMRAAEGHLPWPMTSQMMFHENGQDDRSVLGMVAVQVERDPRTGATTIRSVAPVSAAGVPADGIPTGATVFDDGRKRVLALGGSGGAQPSAEELDQVLSALDGVGMEMVLGEASALPRGGRRGDDGGEEGDAPCDPTQEAPWREGLAENDESLSSYENPEVEVEIEGCYESGGEDDEDYGGRREEGGLGGGWPNQEEADGDGGGYGTEDGPVTLTFLGYTEAAEAGQSLGHEDRGGLLTVERVIIADEEDVREPGREGEAGGGREEEREASPLSQERGGGVGGGEPEEGLAKEGQEKEVFQDVALDGATVEAQRRETGQGAELHPLVAPAQAPPSRAEGEGIPAKSKTCQCCSVM
ncbi:paralemmin-1-like isoform X2 [Osmerus mordax]|uniref:paralemmin-1-like isoform X2 n=1 Tax=Osmerus mordax TaxID=8014 RepID=UPI00350F48FC